MNFFILNVARGWTIAVVILLAMPEALGAQEQAVMCFGRSDRPKYNWIMHCQGCHGVDARGSAGGAPALNGHVGRFLKIKEGRAYLGRVPGVAFVNLSDAETAELLTWVVCYFDRAHVPKAFIPYSEQEIANLRRDSLIGNAYIERQKVLQLLSR